LFAVLEKEEAIYSVAKNAGFVWGKLDISFLDRLSMSEIKTYIVDKTNSLFNLPFRP
jgi:hypothetical protein